MAESVEEEEENELQRLIALKDPAQIEAQVKRFKEFLAEKKEGKRVKTTAERRRRLQECTAFYRKMDGY